MRPRHNKKRSMEEIRNFKTNIPTIPACSSTRFENSGDLNTFSGCLTVRASIAEKMKKLEKAQKSMSDKYEQCLTHLYE